MCSHQWALFWLQCFSFSLALSPPRPTAGGVPFFSSLSCCDARAHGTGDVVNSFKNNQEVGGKCGGGDGKCGGGGVRRDTMTFFFSFRLLLLYFERWRHQSCLQSPHIIRAGRRPSKSLREDRGVLFRFSSFAFLLGFLLLIFFSPQLPDKAATASLPSAPAGRAGVRASPLPPLERPKPRSCTRPPRSGSARCTACR